MDEIEYKLNTNNSVLIVNAIDKLISTIKSKYKPGERQRFVLENEELKFLRDKCSSKEPIVSLTACQGLLALVELGVLEIAHTMSTVVTLLPTAHNYSAIISTMAGLLILDLKSRLIPGQTYKCQFSLKSPQHPFITVLEKNKEAQEDILSQMHALCTHPDYTVSSNSLELLRPVFLWLTCNPQRDGGIRPWQMLLSLPQSTAQSSLLLACLSCQQISNPCLIERALSAYSAVTDTAIYRQNVEYIVALLPMLARISNELVKFGKDPRACYNLIERCFGLDARPLSTVAGITLMLLAENLTHISALYLHPLFNLCLTIISKYEYSTLSLGVFVGLTVQWLNLPSYLTTSALKVAAKIVDTYHDSNRDDNCLRMPNLKANKIFQTLLYTDSHLAITVKLNETWERLRDNPAKLKSWLDSISTVNSALKLELLPFLVGLIMERHKEGYEDVVLKSLDIVVGLVDYKKEVSVQLLPFLTYKIANDKSPKVKWQCLKAVPLMAKTKENVPTIVSILNKLKANKGVPTSFLIMLYASLAETQVRCFPFLHELLVETMVRPEDLKWEVDIAKAMAVKTLCETRASSQGLECVPVISCILNRCGDKGGAPATCLALGALGALWRHAAVGAPSAWRALAPRLARDPRPAVTAGMCQLLSEVPALRVSSPEFDQLVSEAARTLWALVAGCSLPSVGIAACDALAMYKLDDYKLKDIPEIYRKSVQLPPSYCKTPVDAARKPEDVLDYVPCEVWPEVFKYTNQSVLPGVVRLTSKLIEREVRSFRSGVYQHDSRVEQHNLNYLPPSSVLRGLVDCFRRQITSPSYEYQDIVLQHILESLSAEYPRPLPPFELTFLTERVHGGLSWRRGCLTLAARQAQVTVSARRLLDNYLQGVADGTCEEHDPHLTVSLLPLLSRTMPPASLRPAVERCLSSAQTLQDPSQFLHQLDMIRETLESDKTHEANRTLLSLIVEQYFTVLGVEHPAWNTYMDVCKQLSSKYLERMSSPGSWWEVNGELLRKAASLRGALGAAGGPRPLLWLNDIVDAHATHRPEQEYSLCCMLPALQAARVDSQDTKDWFLQLMARTQVAFNEMEDESSKQYLCDVLMLSVLVLSGLWSLEPSTDSLVGSQRRAVSQGLMPPAVAALFTTHWTDCTLQMLEWLCHTRSSTGEPSTARWCQRAIIAMRHHTHFASHRIWTRLESHFGLDIIEE